MITKSLFAAAAVAASLATFSTTQANAGKWDVDVNIGLYDPDYGRGGVFLYDEEPRHYRRPGYYGISCDEGRWTVREAGFRKVRVRECDGRTFTYIGKRHGERFEIRVSRRHGNIVSVREIIGF
jgi:hypothetical protein